MKNQFKQVKSIEIRKKKQRKGKANPTLMFCQTFFEYNSTIVMCNMTACVEDWHAPEGGPYIQYMNKLPIRELNFPMMCLFPTEYTVFECFSLFINNYRQKYRQLDKITPPNKKERKKNNIKQWKKNEWIECIFCQLFLTFSTSQMLLSQQYLFHLYCVCFQKAIASARSNIRYYLMLNSLFYMYVHFS